VVTVFANLAHFALGLPILVAFLIYYGRLRPEAVLLPLPVLVQLLFTLGLALGISALTVHFRDIQNILGHLLHLLFFASPVLYPYAEVSGGLRAFLRLNPMSHVLVSYQEILFDGDFRHWRGLGAAAAAALVTFGLGAFLFDRLRDTLAEEV
jgi:ABC-type polysaccharide/polyol phosphate export permease